MQLNLQALQAGAWRALGAPGFSVEAARAFTARQPAWIHFGAGNIFRAFPAMAQQRLLEAGRSQAGIILCEAFDEEILAKAFIPYDSLSVVVTLGADGTMENALLASITEALAASRSRGRLAEIFAAKSLQLASFTITEKGYAFRDSQGLLPYIQADIAAGPEAAQSLMGLVAGLCYHRFRQQGGPLALVSMDNCSHNGDKLRDAVRAVADGWQAAGLVPPEFLRYLAQSVTYPLTMIDKITPRPAEAVRDRLQALGMEGADIVCTAKHTYVAPFVNAEEAQYLVVEDVFPNGRPPLEEAGVLFTDRATVDKVEKMKVCTCLNPLHTVLGVFGCLLGHASIAAATQDPDLSALVRAVGYDEGLPVVVDPGILEPRAFLAEVLEKRFPNPFVPDTPQRIVCDSSQKIPVRFGETLKAYAGNNALGSLEAIPFFFGGWLRYLLAVDDAGAPFQLSPDPMLPWLQAQVRPITLGAQGPFTEILRPILQNPDLFGLDLFAAGLAGKVEAAFGSMITGPGAVRKALGEFVRK
jgi:fructuronate reductase